MKLLLPGSFVAVGKAALSSYFASLRNYVEIYHDHSEPGGTKIPSGSIPSGSILTATIADRAGTTRKLAVTRVITEATGAFSLGGENQDSGVTTNVNYSYASIILATYTATPKLSDNNSPIGNTKIQFKVAATLQTNFIAVGQTYYVPGAGVDAESTISHQDILAVPSGSQDIKVIWTGAGTTLTKQPRRLELLVFKA